MPRLNIKSTKAAFVKRLKELEIVIAGKKVFGQDITCQEYAKANLMVLAGELLIKIDEEDYK